MRSDSEYVGGIPVVVQLAEDDVLHPMDRPVPAAFVLPRTTMLIALIRDLLLLFRPYITALHPDSTQVWFSVGAAPISWLYPAGAVKDYVNEVTRGERAARLVTTTASPHPSSGTASSSIVASASSISAATATAMTQSLLCSVPSEPLELTFHVHSITKGSVLARAVPLYVHYDRLEEYIRMEVKQMHKAAYTCLYGNYTHYQREAESTLLPAVGLALYRPFDEAIQQQLQQQRDPAPSPGSGGALSTRSAANTVAATFASPFLLLQYQQLLRGVLSPRPHIAYLVRLGFPHAYRGAAGQQEGDYLQYAWHRISAAPALAWTAEAEQGRGDVEGELVEREEEEVTGPLVEAGNLPFGLLLWRLFRLPVLRRQWPANLASAAGPRCEVEATYQQLWRSLAKYYTAPPAAATDRMEEQEPLLTVTPQHPPPWAVWERAMVRALMTDYEQADGVVKMGLPFVTAGAGNDGLSGSSDEERRIRFLVQGLQPSLATPASFLEAHLASSDRGIFVTVQVS